MTTTRILESFVGQLLAVAFVAVSYATWNLLRLANEWRQDMAELRRVRRVERLRKRLSECEA